VQRTVFATPRAAEFFELRALQAQTGQPAAAFGDVVVKELIDNALDAAETAGVAPVIEITTRTDGEITYVSVADNGPGLRSSTIAGVCDFTVLASDKARYRGPARGAQGNALKTVLGIPFALNVTEPITIETRLYTHTLASSIDPAGHVVIDRKRSPGHRDRGTSVTVPLPADLDIDITRWAYGAALVNPHATITAIDQAYPDADAEPILYKPFDNAWSKWTPSSPSSVHWYDRPAFTALVYAYAHHARRSGEDIPLGRFISEFDGLSGSAKQKQIRTAAPGITHLSQLRGRDRVITRLHAAMRSSSRPTTPARLGPVGKDHYRSLLDDRYGVRRFWFKSTTVTVGGVPWIIEVAVADTNKPGHIWFACNHSPAFGDPLGRTQLEAGDIYARGAESFLANVDIHDHAAVVHVICAATQFVDKGKVALVVPTLVAGAASKALAGATTTLRREAEQRRRDAARADRALQRALDDADRADRWTLKDAVFKVLPEAKAAAGDVVAARTLFYKVRPLIQDYTDRELDYSYFSQTLLPEYERTVGPLTGLYYEPRGELHHPHDGKVVPLGTREVENYLPPHWQFDKVLYIEKTGLAAQLAPYRFGQRYDMAIIYGNGYSPTACRTLLARSEIRDMKLFVLHDADTNGYDIARTLGEATRRMPDHQVDVIDLGLTVPQAIVARLEREAFTRRKALPADLELDDDALEWFTGTPFRAGSGKTHYACQRCELNAFSADGLAAFIEAGLRAHDATTKLVPPDDVLRRHTETVRDEALTALVNSELAELIDIDAIVEQLIEDNPDLGAVDEPAVRGRFTEHPAESWRHAGARIVTDNIAGADLADRARELLQQQMGGE
jgi:hypothetical protein